MKQQPNMSRHGMIRSERRLVVSFVVAMIVLGCRGSDLLRVPVPANLLTAGQDSASAESLRLGAIGAFGEAMQGIIPGQILWSAVLTDEIVWSYQNVGFTAVDARALAGLQSTPFDQTFISLQKVRLTTQEAATAVELHEPHGAAAKIAELFALEGYTELLLAEDVCTGVPLSTLNPDGTVADGSPLPTDSIFLRAVSHFDSARAHGGGDAQVTNLVAVGRGRALLDLGRFADAATSVAGVPIAFIYNTSVPADFSVFPKDFLFNFMTVGDGKGANGLHYVSALDPRVVTMNIGQTQVGTVDYFPTKYPMTQAVIESIPLADGVEAGLIVAEAALANGDPGTWLITLNQLRADYTVARGPYPADTSYHPLAPLTDPGSDSARVSLTFRERAFWLYGTGHRLGDLRRLVRQYGRDQSAVFPSGAYSNGTLTSFASYGMSVAFPIGTIEAGNTKFHGCSATTA